jgi:hypothetical protein
VGHWGYVVVYSVITISASRRLALAAEPRTHHGFIYDPVHAWTGYAYPFVAVSDGYGSKLKLVDVEGGELRSCPDALFGGTPTWYGRFGNVIPSRDRKKMLVWTKNGWLLWDLTTNNSTWLCSCDLDPLHFGGGSMWAISKEEPAMLLRYVVHD